MDKKLKDWQEEIDQIDVDLDTDADGISESFENQKAKLNSFLASSIDSMGKLVGEDNSNMIKGKLEELQLQLNLGKAETSDLFEEQRKKLENKISEAEQYFSTIKEDENHKYNSQITAVDNVFNSFKTRMEVFRLHYALAKADAGDELEEAKGNVKTKLNELKLKMDKRKSEATEKSKDVAEQGEAKWDDFSKDMTEAFGNISSAIKGLFS